MDRWLLTNTSRCLGWIDVGFGWALRHVMRHSSGRPSATPPRFFTQGWGDLTVVQQARQQFFQRLAESHNNNPPSPHHHQRPAAAAAQQHQEEDQNGNHGQNNTTKNMRHLYSHLTDQIQWGTPSKLKSVDVCVTEGRFPSPIAHLLPPESKECQFFLVQPASSSSGPNDDYDDDNEVVKKKTSQPRKKPMVYVIMLPATGEMGKRERINMATTLATRHGWCSIIVTAPLYGARKPPQQPRWFVNTVSDYLLQSQAMMEEAAALTLYCLQLSSSSSSPSPASQPNNHNNNNTHVCLTGFSWGAAMAGCASGMALLALAGTTTSHGTDSTRIACVPYVGSSTPAVLTDGLLQDSIDWQALMNATSSSSSSLHHHPQQQQSHSGAGDNCPTTAANDDDDLLNETKKKLHAVFEDFNLMELLEMLQQTRRRQYVHPQSSSGLGALQIVAMEHDHFIRRHWTEAFIADMNQLVHVPTSTTTQFPVQWLMGGHVVAALVRSRYQTRAIETAVQALR